CRVRPDLQPAARGGERGEVGEGATAGDAAAELRAQTDRFAHPVYGLFLELGGDRAAEPGAGEEVGRRCEEGPEGADEAAGTGYVREEARVVDQGGHRQEVPDQALHRIDRAQPVP